VETTYLFLRCHLSTVFPNRTSGFLQQTSCSVQSASLPCRSLVSVTNITSYVAQPVRRLVGCGGPAFHSAQGQGLFSSLPRLGPHNQQVPGVKRTTYSDHSPLFNENLANSLTLIFTSPFVFTELCLKCEITFFYYFLLCVIVLSALNVKLNSYDNS
jgi:hypothetical protein